MLDLVQKLFLRFIVPLVLYKNIYSNLKDVITTVTSFIDRLCGLVVTVSGYRSRSPRFDSRSLQIFWEAVGLERGPLSLVRTTEELLGRNNSGSGLENRHYRPWESVALTMRHPLSAKVGGRSVGIVRSRTKAKDLLFTSFIHISTQNRRMQLLEYLIKCSVHHIHMFRHNSSIFYLY
jgi:hypothetical protein